MINGKELADMSLDEIAKILERDADVGVLSAAAAGEPLAEIENAQTVDITPKEVVEDKAETEPVETEAAPDGGANGKTEPEEDLDAAILKAEREEEKAQRKHFEALAGKHAGELGFLKTKFREMEARLAQKPQEQAFEAEPAIEFPTKQVQRTPDAIVQWASRQAFQSAISSFSEAHPDLSEMTEALKSARDAVPVDVESIMALSDPREVERETASLLEQVYWKAKTIHQATIRTQLEVRKAEQVKGLTEAKKKASISGSGGIAPARTQAKSIDEMSLTELSEAMRRSAG